MLQATRPRLHAFVVFLGLLLAFTAPAAAQQLSQAQTVELEQDADRLADLMVEYRNLFLGQNTTLTEPERRARNGEITRDMDALRAKWRARSQALEARLTQRAEELAAPRHLAERERYAREAPVPPEPSQWDQTLEAAAEIAGRLWFTFGGFIQLVLTIAVLAPVLWLLWWLSRFFRTGDQPKELPPLSDNYGTASYADVRSQMPHFIYAVQGVFFGKSSAPELDQIPLAEQRGAPVLSTPEHHTLIVARTRTGKGTRVIVPTLLRYAGSAIVIDPKGENAAITARVRFGMLNKEVHVINPWGELATTFKARGLPPATFNPLDVLDRNDPNAVAVAQSLAGAICPSSPGDKDRYWQGSAANVLTAVLLWIADQPDEQKTLARAREIVSLSRKDFTDRFLVPMAASSAFGGAIREMVSPYLDLAQETYSGIMANLSENTKFLSDPQVKAATATSSFDMADLIRDPVTIYLVIPPDRIDTQRTWLRLMTAAAMHTFKRYPLDGRPPHRCMILMDEFPALGRIEDMPRDIATMSGYGIDFTLIVQGIDQLKDHYGAAAGTILSNCAYKWFCNVSDLESAKYLSDTLGKATVRTVGKGESHNEGPGGAGKGESINYGETGRPLLMPDEVLSLGREVAIVLNPDGRPHYLRPVDYSAPIWMTFKQAQELGGHVRKGEKGNLVVYANTITKTETDENGQESERDIPFMKGYTVFNVEQVEGLPAHFYALAERPAETVQRIAHAEAFFAATGADIRHGGDRAFFSPAEDRVQMPPIEAFRDAEAYYATLAHELTHWTKGKGRLERDFGRKRFGDSGYAMEELVAELGAAFLCADLALSPEPRDEHAAYLAHWLAVLKEDKRAIFSAAAHAQRAADYLHGLQPQAEEERQEVAA